MPDITRVNEFSHSYAMPAANLLTMVPVSGLLQNGIAHVLGLEVLAHGSSWSNTLNILQQGLLASKGGNDTGSFAAVNSYKAEEACGGFAYVVRDSAYGDGKPLNLYQRFWKATTPRFHSVFSTVAQCNKKEDTAIVRLAKILFALFTAPAIRFMYKPDELGQFENDPDYGTAAYRTREDLPTDRIGIIGAFRHGCDGKVLERIQRNPGKALTGVVEIVAGLAITALGLGWVL